MTLEWIAALAAGLVAGGLLLYALVRWAGQRPDRYRALVLTATALTFCLVVLGAYVRLSDAGLGCPDWPGCYGHPQVSAEALPGARGALTAPQISKGWKEMVHRYVASFVGLLIAAIVAVAVRERRRLGQSPSLALALLAVVLVQAALGRWTVTLLLKPAIVSLHLAGGMATFALLVWLSSRQLAAHPPPGGLARWRFFAIAALALIACQILLGGWVSSNYAALACPDLPLCRGAWIPAMDASNAFHIVRDLGKTGEGELLSLDALTAIHWVHRVGAVVVVAVCSGLAAALLRERRGRAMGAALLVAAWGQAALGIGNVLFGLPLPLAAAHTAGAALLLATAVVINFRVATALTARLSSITHHAAPMTSPGQARGS